MSKRINRDDIDRFHDFSLYLPSRTLYMGSESSDGDGAELGVDNVMAERQIKNLIILDTMSDDPITLIMNNPGGDVNHGLAIYDAILSCRSKVIIKVFGYAMSMGSVILQAADERIMSKHASQMIHYGHMSVDRHCKTVDKQVKESERINDWMEQMYLKKIKEKHPTYKLSALKKLLDHDTFLTAEESVALGLADSILE